MPSSNQMSEFLKQIYLRRHVVNQPDILFLDRVQGRLIVIQIFSGKWDHKFFGTEFREG